MGPHISRITDTTHLISVAFNSSETSNDRVENLVLPNGVGVGGSAVNYGWPLEIAKIVSGAGRVESIKPAFEPLSGAGVFSADIITFTGHGRDMQVMEWGGWDLGNCTNQHFNLSYMNGWHVVAADCSFYACVRDYHGSVQNTVFTETALSEIPIVLPPNQTQDMTIRGLTQFVHSHTPCLVDGQAYTIDNASSIPSNATNFRPLC